MAEIRVVRSIKPYCGIDMERTLCARQQHVLQSAINSRRPNWDCACLPKYRRRKITGTMAFLQLLCKDGALTESSALEASR